MEDRSAEAARQRLVDPLGGEPVGAERLVLDRELVALLVVGGEPQAARPAEGVRRPARRAGRAPARSAPDALAASRPIDSTVTSYGAAPPRSAKPPFRPLAPPAISRASCSRTFSPASASASAAAQPVTPAADDHDVGTPVEAPLAGSAAPARRASSCVSGGRRSPSHRHEGEITDVLDSLDGVVGVDDARRLDLEALDRARGGRHDRVPAVGQPQHVHRAPDRVDGDPGVNVEPARARRDRQACGRSARVRVVDLERLRPGQDDDVVLAQRDLPRRARRDRDVAALRCRCRRRRPRYSRGAPRSGAGRAIGACNAVFRSRRSPTGQPTRWSVRRLHLTALVRRPAVDRDPVAAADEPADPAAGQRAVDVAGADGAREQPLLRRRQRGRVEVVVALGVPAQVHDPGEPGAGDGDLRDAAAGAGRVGAAGCLPADERGRAGPDVPDEDLRAARRCPRRRTRRVARPSRSTRSSLFVFVFAAGPGAAAAGTAIEKRRAASVSVRTSSSSPRRPKDP